MFDSDYDYLKLLNNPQFYMRQKLELYEMQWESVLEREFPVAKCGDIFLYFNHYTSFDSANELWEKRQKRINETA